MFAVGKSTFENLHNMHPARMFIVYEKNIGGIKKRIMKILTTINKFIYRLQYQPLVDSNQADPCIIVVIIFVIF
jgi:hypothetical protein